MVKNYFVVAIRYLMRHKLYTFINLFGLGLGLACCLMMALFVKHEWASDGFHQNEDELFRVVKQRLLPNGEAGAFGSIEGANLKDPVIIGIVRDFHTDALYEPIQPVVLQMSQFNNWPAFFVHMRSDQLSDTLDMLKETWKAIVPSGRFQFSFLDRNLHRQYEQEDRWREIVSHSALFFLIISCLGLFGLASLAVVQRTKEIGVRKVLGASERYLVWLLSKDFAKLLLLANAIAWPAAYWIMNEWLTTTFAYHMDLGIGVFIFVGALTYGIAQLTILGHILKVIRQNPVQALRYE